MNTGKTYNADGTLRYDFDASNAKNPKYNGDVCIGYEDDVPVYVAGNSPEGQAELIRRAVRDGIAKVVR